LSTAFSTFEAAQDVNDIVIDIIIRKLVK